MQAMKISQMTGHDPNSRGLDDGGLGVGGKLFPGQATSLFGEPEDFNQRRKNVRKKKRRKTPERPGEQKYI
jgi:hypothetical protein